MNSTEAVKVLREALGDAIELIDADVSFYEGVIAATKHIEQVEPVAEIRIYDGMVTVSSEKILTLPHGTLLYTSPQPAKPDALVPGWINVNDKLPQTETQKVIVWCNLFYVPSYEHVYEHVGVYKNGKWDVGDSRVNGSTGYVSHWMPLPAAPSTDKP